MNAPVIRTALVTGATSGIGRVVAQALAGVFDRLYLIVRDPSKGRSLAADLMALAPKCTVEFIEADLRSLAAIEHAAAIVQKGCDRLHVLVNNAGIVTGQRRETGDGFEEMFAVNHLAYFALSQRLYPLLQAAGETGNPARIVNVASDAHRRAQLDFTDLMAKKSFRPYRVYANSKLANVLFTRELAVRLRGQSIIANALHPGVVASGFGRGESRAWFALGMRLIRPFLRTPEEGAKTAIYLALSPEVVQVSGGYFQDEGLTKVSARGENAADAQRLWEISVQLSGLDRIP